MGAELARPSRGSAAARGAALGRPKAQGVACSPASDALCFRRCQVALTHAVAGKYKARRPPAGALRPRKRRAACALCAAPRAPPEGFSLPARPQRPFRAACAAAAPPRPRVARLAARGARPCAPQRLR